MIAPNSETTSAEQDKSQSEQKALSVSSTGAERQAFVVADDKNADNKPATAIYLSIDDCVEIAIMNNLGLRINRINDRESDIAVAQAWAQYFPVFNLGVAHSNASKSKVTTDANGNVIHETAGAGTNSATGGFTQQSPWGTQLDFSLSEARTSFDRGTAKGNAAVNILQPLWKGAGTDVGLSAIRTARINRLISRGTLELDVQTLIFNVRSDYSQIIRQLGNLEVDKKGVETSEAFLKLTDARFRAGQVTALDVSNAKVQLENQQLAQLRDQQAVDNALDVLKQLLYIDFNENVTVDYHSTDFGDIQDKDAQGQVIHFKELRIDHTEGTVTLVVSKLTKDGKAGEEISRTVLFKRSHFDDEKVLAEAMENRIELLNQYRTVAVQKLQALLTKNGLGHEVDLVGGLGRTTNGRSIGESSSGNSTVNNWNYGLNYKIPWGKIQDRAAYETALLDLQKAEIQLASVRQSVENDVRNILRTLRVTEESLLIQGDQVEQAKRSAEASRISFERGLQSSFDVILAENNLLAAKRGYINSEQDYFVSLQNLRKVIGKATGRVNLAGGAVGGLIDANIPDELRKRMPRTYSDPPGKPEDDPLSDLREYRKDYHADKHSPVIVEPGQK
jgi:outer membrane protein TolC